MKNALLIHGTPDREEYFDPAYPSPSNSHWFPWLQKQLLIREYETQTPEMPKSYKPDYEAWRFEFERHAVTEETLLVGHSCGGGFLVRWLSEHPQPVTRLILAAPWMDPFKNHCVPGFFDFKINPELTELTDLHLIYSDNDSEEVELSVGKIKQELPRINLHLMPGLGHFCTSDLGLSDSGRTEFPALLSILLQGLD